MPARSGAAGAAAMPAELLSVPVHGEVRGAAPADAVPSDSEALIVALGRLYLRRQQQPRSADVIKRAEDLVVEALLCVAEAEDRKRRFLAR